MNRRLRLLGALSAAVVLSVGTIGIAVAQAPAPTPGGSIVSTCDNPILQADAAGWGTIRGTAGQRLTEPDQHASGARHAYVQLGTTANPSVYTPHVLARGGDEVTLAVDTRSNRSGRYRMEVDWYSAESGGNFLGHTDGPWVDVTAGAMWTRIPGVFTAPAGALRGQPTIDAEYATAGGNWGLTACSYTRGAAVTPPPTTTVPPVTTDPTTVPPTTTVPPVTTQPPAPGAGAAATAFNWGAPRWADEFNYAGAPDPNLWFTPLPWGPEGCGAGHAGQGRRCHSNSTVGGGVLTQVGEPNGDTGWIGSKADWYRGKWETRMRIDPTATRDNEYHPVVLLWPRAEDFPCGGEVDYAEATSASTQIDFFLHYSCSNQTTNGNRALDLTQWHDYAVEWNASCMIGWVDGQEYFRDCNTSHLPPRAMFEAIQLDFFPDGTAGPGEVRMQVDWTRSYA